MNARISCNVCRKIVLKFLFRILLFHLRKLRHSRKIQMVYFFRNADDLRRERAVFVIADDGKISTAAARDNQLIRLNRQRAASVVAACAKLGDYYSVAVKRSVTNYPNTFLQSMLSPDVLDSRCNIACNLHNFALESSAALLP